MYTVRDGLHSAQGRELAHVGGHTSVVLSAPVVSGAILGGGLGPTLVVDAPAIEPIRIAVSTDVLVNLRARLDALNRSTISSPK